MQKEVKGTFLIFLTALVSGIAIVVNKFFVAKIDPLVLTAIRAFFIGIIFFVISVVMLHSKKSKRQKFNRVSWKYLIAIGLIGGGLAFWLFFVGLKLTTSGRAAFLHKTLPIYATILAIIFLKEKITKTQLIALGTMLFGLILLELPHLPRDIRTGDLLVVIATILWAIENTIAKKAMIKKESNWVVTFSRMFFGSLLLFSIMLIAGKMPLIVSLTMQQLIYIGISGLFLTAYVLTWYWGLKYINLSKASTILLLAPVISLILGVIWLHEKIFDFQIIGSLFILVGAYLIVNVKSEHN